MKLYDLQTSHLVTPIIDQIPEFSWRILSDEKDINQKDYRIVVYNAKNSEVVWDSGLVSSKKQSFIKYEGSKMESRQKYFWKVTVTTDDANRVSEKSWFETGLLDESEWKACWVEYPFERVSASEYKFGNSYPAILFKRKFEVEKPVQSAKVYASAYGTYRLEVNKIRPDNRELAPEFTTYDKTLYYQTYDVTRLLEKGENLLTMYVGDGWYFSAQAGPLTDNLHKSPSVIYQMEITYTDGTREIVASDGSESTCIDYIVYSDLYQGEKQDFTLGDFEETGVVIKDYGYSNLQAQPTEPIIATRIIPAIDIFTTPKGETIVDFGQILTGRARINIDLPAGCEAVFEYFEVLDAECNYINTMFAPQKDTVVSAGKPLEHEALFTFHGFRYIKVTGITNPKKEDFKAVLLTTKKENRGTFECSDQRFNRLYENVRWSQYNNMMSVPTDCPTREKAGWTGDILIYAKTAMMNEAMTPFLKSWLHSVRNDQANDGVIKIVAPYMKLYKDVFLAAAKLFGDDVETGVAGWSDAIVWVPYDMYKVTGDRMVLEENYDSMIMWADYVIRTAKEKRGYKDIPEKYDQYLWNTGFHFGEWLVPSRPDNTGEQYGICKESSYYIAPYWGYETVRRMSEICAELGHPEEANYYSSLADKMKYAIQEGMFRRGVLPDYLMGAYVLAFAFDLVPDDLYDDFKSILISLIHKNNDCLDTGFLATPYILDVLCDLGEKELAYKILWSNKMPSWLYEVEHGATTIWEAWDADKARTEGGFISYNHYAFGCVDDFICRRIAGIDSDTVGFDHIIIRPDIECGLDYCKRTYLSEAGTIAVNWNKTKIDVSIPVNTTATVYWNNQIHEIGSGEYTFS